MPLALSYRYFGGEGQPPLVILHGLLGSSRNWTTAGKLLSRSFEVFALDLRGHGDSPWAPNGDAASDAPTVRDYSFAACADDVAAWLDAKGVRNPILLGHSFGGKVAMRLAVDSPSRCRALVVADIAPRDYAPHHVEAFAAMRSLDLTKLTSRAEAEEKLKAQLHDENLARFLLTNLVRKAEVDRPSSADFETITTTAKGVGRFIRQSGGRGQYGHVEIELEPNTLGRGIEIINVVSDGQIPERFIPAIKRGIEEAANGPNGGHPVTDFKVRITFGSFHELDSNDMAFTMAGIFAFKDAFKSAQPVLIDSGNLPKNPADLGFRWRIDVEGLYANLPQLSRSSLKPGETYAGSTLFLRGENSDFIRESDRPLIAAHFPRHQILALGRAGHNLHVDQPAAFATALEYFALDMK